MSKVAPLFENPVKVTPEMDLDTLRESGFYLARRPVSAPLDDDFVVAVYENVVDGARRVLQVAMRITNADTYYRVVPDAWKPYSSGGGGATDAASVTYDSSTSGLIADDVQEAIDELVARILSLGADDISVDSSSFATLQGGNVQLVLEDIDAKIASSGANTDLSVDRDSTTVTVESSTGNNAVIPAATDTAAGVLSAADKSKLDGIEAGAEVNPTGTEIVSAIDAELGSDTWQTGGTTDLSFERDATTVTVESSTGDSAILPAATDTAAGVLSAADKSKLDGIEAGAEVNPTGTEIVSAIDAELGSDTWQTGGTTDLSFERDATTVTVESSTGDSAILPAATDTAAGVLSAADKSKLDGIEAGAEENPTGTEIVSAIDAELGSDTWQTGGTTDLSFERDATTVTVESSTGSDAILPAATDTEAGVLSAADKSKLDGIEAGAEVNPTGTEIVSAIDTELGSDTWQTGGSTDLSFERDATTVTVESSTGTDAILPAATDTAAGVLSAADKSKLDGIEAGAEENPTGTEIVSAIDAELGNTDWQTGGSTDLSFERDATTVTVESSTGTDAILPAATDTAAGVLSAADKSKLDGIEAGAEVNPTGTEIVSAIDTELGSDTWQSGASSADQVSVDDTSFTTLQGEDVQAVLEDIDTKIASAGSNTDLSISRDATTVTVESSTGNNGVIPSATTVDAGVLSAADKAKLDGIEAGAEANPTGTEIVSAIDTELGSDTWQTGGSTDLSFERDATTVTVESSTGDSAILPAATDTAAGVLSAADKSKLDGIEAGAEENPTGTEIVSAIDAELGNTDWQTGGSTDLSFERDATTVTVESSTGDSAILPAATDTAAGVLSAADKAKLDGIEAGAEVNPTGEDIVALIDIELGTDSWQDPANTNLSIVRDDTTVTVESSTGSDAVVPAATTLLAGVMLATDKSKLDGIEAGAEVNPSAEDVVELIDTELGSTTWRDNEFPPSAYFRVRVSTIEPINLATALASGETLDTVVLAIGDLVLVKDQSNATENGIYVVNEFGAPSVWMSPDFWAGAAFYVAEGNDNGGQTYQNNNVAPIDFGVDAVAFSAFFAGLGTDLSQTKASTTIELHSSTGANTTLTGATDTEAGLMTAPDRIKLTSISTGAQVNPTGSQIVDAINTELGSADWQGSEGDIPPTPSARLATNGNITISTGLVPGQLVDGVILDDGDAVLVKDQDNASLNGVYLVSSSPSRHPLYNTFTELAGMIITVREGGLAAGTVWMCTSVDSGVIGLDFVEFTRLAVTPTNLGNTPTATQVNISSTTGTATDIPSATTSLAGVMSAADKTKLDGIAEGATNIGPTDLTVTRTSTTVTVNSSTGTEEPIAAADGTNAGVMTSAMFTKLDGIEAGAEVNPSGSDIVDLIDTALGHDDWQEGPGNIAATGVTVDETNLTNVSGATVQAIVESVDTAVGTIPEDAEDVDYVNTTSGLAATNVQAAIDEIVGDISSLAAEDISYSGSTSGLTATDVQAAIDEIAAAVDTTETDITVTPSATEVAIASSTGSGDTIPSATTSLAGALSAADKTKLDGIEPGATAAGPTDLTVTRTSTTVTVNSSTGTEEPIAAADGTNAGVMTSAMFTKLDGIEAGAEVNPSGSDIVDLIDTALGHDDWQEGPGNIAATGVTVDETNLTNVSGATVQAIVESVDTAVGTIPEDAEDVDYVNTTSGLAATNVQAAIDEIVVDIGDVAGDLSNLAATGVSFDNVASGLTATDVQAALDELSSLVVANDTDITISRDATTVTVESSTGDNGVIPEATSLAAGVLTAADKAKLDGVETGAQVNLVGNSLVSAIDAALGSDDWQGGQGDGDLGAAVRVRVATTTNVVIDTSLNPGDVLDGVTLELGDLVLVREQTDSALNGIYTVSAAPVNRTPAYNSFPELTGLLVSVREGTTLGGYLFAADVAGTGTIGTDPIVFNLHSPTTLTLDRSLMDIAIDSDAGEAVTIPGATHDLAGSMTGWDKFFNNEIRATTVSWTNVNLSAGIAGGVNGHAVANGDVVVLAQQTLPEENGVYIAGGTPALRHVDYSDYSRFPGLVVRVTGGYDKGRILIADVPSTGTVDTTPIAFKYADPRPDKVVAATTENIVISSSLNPLDVIDGVTLAEGDLVLVKNQTNPAENGVYYVRALPHRPYEYKTMIGLSGSLVSVRGGTENAGTLWVCTTASSAVLGTDPIEFLPVNMSDDVLLMTEENQGPITGGWSVTPKNLGEVSSGTLTIDVSARPQQIFANNGAFTLSPGAASGSCIVIMTNAANAGAVDISSWTESFGDHLDDDEGSIFRLGVEIINAVALLYILKIA